MSLCFTQLCHMHICLPTYFFFWLLFFWFWYFWLWFVWLKFFLLKNFLLFSFFWKLIFFFNFHFLLKRQSLLDMHILRKISCPTMYISPVKKLIFMQLWANLIIAKITEYIFSQHSHTTQQECQTTWS